MGRKPNPFSGIPPASSPKAKGREFGDDLKIFQRTNGLTADGVMKLGGPTQDAIQANVAKMFGVDALADTLRDGIVEGLRLRKVRELEQEAPKPGEPETPKLPPEDPEAPETPDEDKEPEKPKLPKPPEPPKDPDPCKDIVDRLRFNYDRLDPVLLKIRNKKAMISFLERQIAQLENGVIPEEFSDEFKKPPVEPKLPASPDVDQDKNKGRPRYHEDFWKWLEAVGTTFESIGEALEGFDILAYLRKRRALIKKLTAKLKEEEKEVKTLEILRKRIQDAIDIFQKRLDACLAKNR